MINIDNKVKNVYYMLCYVFYGDRLTEREEGKFGTESYDNLNNLFATLLCLLLDKQIKKGTYKNYVNLTEEVSKIKGKISIPMTINSSSLVRRKVVCDYDEYSNNNLINQIILTTINYLIRSNKTGNFIKARLNRIKMFFVDVDEIKIKSIKWDTIKYDRNNKAYKYIIDLCKMLIQNVIVVDDEGNTHFKEFFDGQTMNDLYERFLRKYYSDNYPEYLVKVQHLKFNKNKTYDLIPDMFTDISIIDKKNSRVLIIDAKFYGQILSDGRSNESNNSDPRTVIKSSNNIYQMLSYVQSNKVVEKYNEVYGLILYAQTLKEPPLDLPYMSLNNNLISIKTIDMNSNWVDIESRLKAIMNEFKDGKIKETI